MRLWKWESAVKINRHEDARGTHATVIAKSWDVAFKKALPLTALGKNPQLLWQAQKKKNIRLDYQFCDCLFILGVASEFALKSRKKNTKNEVIWFTSKRILLCHLSFLTCIFYSFCLLRLLCWTNNMGLKRRKEKYCSSALRLLLSFCHFRSLRQY